MADQQVDSHEIDYIPKIDSASVNSVLHGEASGGHPPGTLDHSTSQVDDYNPDIFKEILLSSGGNNKQHKRHRNKHYTHQVTSSYKTGIQRSSSSSSSMEMKDQTYTSFQYSTQVVPPSLNNGGRISGSKFQDLATSSNSKTKSGRTQSLKEHDNRQSGDTYHTGYIYNLGEKTYRNDLGYAGESWIYGTPLEEGYNTDPPPKASLGNEEKYFGPRFDRSLTRNITVLKGKTAVLACKVLDIGEKSVSWIRHDDLHILSVGNDQYSTDKRISVLHEANGEGDEEWMLTIEDVTETDAGMYECQVSTKPVLSFIVNLLVIVPKAEIINGPEIFVHKGSQINLTCVVTHGTEKPIYVYWYHHDKLINYEGRGGVELFTVASRNTISQLRMRDATSNDTGVYTCKPSNGEESSATLHVLNGEYQAAMQVNSSASVRASWGGAVAWICAAIMWQLPRIWLAHTI